MVDWWMQYALVCEGMRKTFYMFSCDCINGLSSTTQFHKVVWVGIFYFLGDIFQHDIMEIVI